MTALLLVWSILSTDFLAVPLALGIFLLLQVYGLVKHVEAHVNALEEFFAAVNYDDFTRRFVEQDVDAELKQAFNRVIARFQNARAERDLQAGYLETLVKHVPVPFFATKPNGAVSLVNNPVKRLTGLASLKNLEQLAELDPSLPDRMRSIGAGEQQLLQTRLRGVPAELRVTVAEIRVDGGAERLYSLENLSGELTAREASAWRNLIRVLTHEMMNTLTPVTSLAQSAVGLLDDATARNELREAIQTIARRSEGLTSFVLKYRELLNVPQPVSSTISVTGLLNNVATLLRNDLSDVLLAIEVVPESLEVEADDSLIDQVLLNLVRNAIDATEHVGPAKITLSGHLSFGRVAISVNDNGAGIDDDVIEQIFVPFFTTKRNGSGIGLSLSRQIMTAHGGEIAVESGAGGTTMKLVF